MPRDRNVPIRILSAFLVLFLLLLHFGACSSEKRWRL